MNQERSILAAASVLCPVLYRILNSCNNHHHMTTARLSWFVCWCQPITVLLCSRLCRTGSKPGPLSTTLSQCLDLNLPRVARAGADRRGERWEDSGGRDSQHC